MLIRVRIIVRRFPSEKIIGIANMQDEGGYNRTGLEPGSLYSFQVVAGLLNERLGMNGPTVTGVTAAPCKFHLFDVK